MKNLFAIVLVVISIASYCQGNGEGFGSELGSLDFKNIIGSPLVAVIQAQAAAAKMTTDFIDQVGLVVDAQGKKTVKTVSFDYTKLDGNNTLKNFTLTVPFLMMIPIPYIEVNVITIDLNVKLNSIDSSESSSTFKSFAEVEVGGGWWGSSFNFKGGYSYSSSSKYTGTVEREYALTVHVQAGQAGLPKGTERIMDMLESVIRETPDVKAA